MTKTARPAASSHGSLPLDKQELHNAARLAAAAVKDDYSFSAEAEALRKDRLDRKRLDRRSSKNLHKSVSGGLLMVLAVHKLPTVQKQFRLACKESGIEFKTTTPVAARVARVFISDDPSRASDYGKAIRGAIIKGYSPKKLLKLLDTGKETLTSLMRAVDPLPTKKRIQIAKLTAAGSEKSISLSLSKTAEARIAKVKSATYRLAVVKILPNSKKLFVSAVTSSVKSAAKTYKSKLAA
ncbi:hypothetical protein [Ferrovibrio sp.]|uniref:hypothetical protein n=1 Tax=Ferrovibrio sp. TaxID=1917215 RepID=UPI0035B0B982